MRDNGQGQPDCAGHHHSSEQIAGLETQSEVEQQEDDAGTTGCQRLNKALHAFLCAHAQHCRQRLVQREQGGAVNGGA